MYFLKSPNVKSLETLDLHGAVKSTGDSRVGCSGVCFPPSSAPSSSSSSPLTLWLYLGLIPSLIPLPLFNSCPRCFASTSIFLCSLLLPSAFSHLPLICLISAGMCYENNAVTIMYFALHSDAAHYQQNFCIVIISATISVMCLETFMTRT